MILDVDDSYNNLLLTSNSLSIHQRHLRFLVIEIFKSISQINSNFIWWSFQIYQELSPPTMAQMLFTLEVLLYGTIFLLKFNPAIQFSNLKPKLKMWKVDCGCFICR